MAASPLQAEPLPGNVYLVDLDDPRTLPDLGVDLKGGLALKVKGALSASRSRRLQIVVTFDGLPDIPLSEFTLTFAAGPAASTSSTRSPCEPPPFASTRTSRPVRGRR